MPPAGSAADVWQTWASTPFNVPPDPRFNPETGTVRTPAEYERARGMIAGTIPLPADYAAWVDRVNRGTASSVKAGLPSVFDLYPIGGGPRRPL